MQAEFVISYFADRIHGVSDSEPDPLSSLLSSFALGPSWARAVGEPSERKQKSPGVEERPRRPEVRDRSNRGESGPRNFEGGERRPFKSRNPREDDRRNSPPPVQEVPPAEGVRATIAPDPHAVHLIGKEVHQVARVYGLFDVAKILLAEKSRCRAIFEVLSNHPPLIVGKTFEAVFLTREEAGRHFWKSELREQFIEEETIEVDPPTGNFQAIARCGISGEWLGPVNFHSYQTNLRRLHRERYARMPFEIYSSKVRTERGEEAVNAWLETTKKKTRWRIKGDTDDAWLDDVAEAERALTARCFDEIYQEARIANVSGAIPPQNLSPALLTSLKISGTHARNHPAILIPAVCKAVEAEHLPVFKRLGKLHTGPARPHPLPLNAVLAERPEKMVSWIRENTPAKLEGLWKSVLPEGSTAPPAEYAADLFWLLHQGHILLYADDTLVVQEARDPAQAAIPPGPKAKKKRKPRKRNSEGATVTEAGENDLEKSAAVVDDATENTNPTNELAPPAATTSPVAATGISDEESSPETNQNPSGDADDHENKSQFAD